MTFSDNVWTVIKALDVELVFSGDDDRIVTDRLLVVYMYFTGFIGQPNSLTSQRQWQFGVLAPGKVELSETVYAEKLTELYQALRKICSIQTMTRLPNDEAGNRQMNIVVNETEVV